MNIKDFLIDNYVWILAIILITIVTIIGFLADKKKNDKKKENAAQQQPSNENNLAPMQYQEQSQSAANTMGMNNALGFPLPQQSTQINNMANPQPTSPFMMNTPNNLQAVENVMQSQENQQPYQPLGEQKPIIEPTIQTSNINMNNNQMMPEPGLQQPITMNNTYQDNNIMATMNQPTSISQTTIPQPVQQPMTANVIPTATPNINNTNVINPSNATEQMQNPQPLNQPSIPQPVIPQPIMPQSINQPMPSLNQQPQIQPTPMNQTATMEPIQQMPAYNIPTPMPVPEQMMTQPQMTNTQQSMQQPMQPNSTTPQSVSFVFGPQNNNQNM